MMHLTRDSRVIATVTVAIAMVTATYIAASSWKEVRTKPKERTLKVTGSAKKRIHSDLIEWTGTVTATGADRSEAYRSLHEQVGKARAYLEEHGIAENRIEVSAVGVSEINQREYVGTGAERVERVVFRGYRMTQSISLRSTDVAKIERISREITDLIEQGVEITSFPPQYYFTKLGELKIEMLAEASKDARARALNIVSSAGGGKVGRLLDADMGVINVNPANSTATSWEGINDTSSYEKDIITIVHVTYRLD